MNDIRSIDAARPVGRADHAPGASTAAPTSQPSLPRRGHGTFGLRAHLLALVLAALLPALVVGAAAVWQAALGHRAAFKARLADTARALALAADSEIESHFAALHALAAAPQLDPETGDLAAFHDQARRAGDALGTWITVHGASPGLPMLLNTNAAFGAPSPRPRPQAQLPAAPVPLEQTAEEWHRSGA